MAVIQINAQPRLIGKKIAGFRGVAPLEERAGRTYWAANTVEKALLNAAEQGYAPKIRRAAAYGLSRADTHISKELWMELKELHNRLRSGNGTVLEPSSGANDSEKEHYSVYLAFACLLSKTPSRWNPVFSALPYSKGIVHAQLNEKGLMDQISEWGRVRAQAWSGEFRFAFEAGRGNGNLRKVQEARAFVENEMRASGVKGLMELLDGSFDGQMAVARRLPGNSRANARFVIEEAFIAAAKIEVLDDAIRAVSQVANEVRDTQFGEFAAYAAGELLARLEALNQKTI